MVRFELVRVIQTIRADRTIRAVRTNRVIWTNRAIRTTVQTLRSVMSSFFVSKKKRKFGYHCSLFTTVCLLNVISTQNDFTFSIESSSTIGINLLCRSFWVVIMMARIGLSTRVVLAIRILTRVVVVWVVIRAVVLIVVPTVIRPVVLLLVISASAGEERKCVRLVRKFEN